MTPLEVAYAVHAPGSPAFLAAVDFAGRYQVSDTEARRIALESDSAAVWERTWRMVITVWKAKNSRQDRQAPRALKTAAQDSLWRVFPGGVVRWQGVKKTQAGNIRRLRPQTDGQIVAFRERT